MDIIKPKGLIVPTDNLKQLETKTELELKMDGWRDTTLDLLYHMPKHPGLLQQFTWETLDLPRAEFPRMHKFLEFWRVNIEAAIHSVQFCVRDEVTGAGLRGFKGNLRGQSYLSGVYNSPTQH